MTTDDRRPLSDLVRAALDAAERQILDALEAERQKSDPNPKHESDFCQRPAACAPVESRLPKRTHPLCAVCDAVLTGHRAAKTCPGACRSEQKARNNRALYQRRQAPPVTGSQSAPSQSSPKRNYRFGHEVPDEITAQPTKGRGEGQ